MQPLFINRMISPSAKTYVIPLLFPGLPFSFPCPMPGFETYGPCDPCRHMTRGRGRDANHSTHPSPADHTPIQLLRPLEALQASGPCGPFGGFGRFNPCNPCQPICGPCGPCEPLKDCRPCIPVVYKKLLEVRRSGLYSVVFLQLACM